jgi:hypothetical protein
MQTRALAGCSLRNPSSQVYFVHWRSIRRSLSPMRSNSAKALLMNGCEPHSSCCKTKTSAKKSVQRWQCPVSGTGKLLADAGDGRRAIGDHTEPIRRLQDVALARLRCVMPPGLVPDNIRRLRRCACGSGQGVDSGDLTA